MEILDRSENDQAEIVRRDLLAAGLGGDLGRELIDATAQLTTKMNLSFFAKYLESVQPESLAWIESRLATIQARAAAMRQACAIVQAFQDRRKWKNANPR